MNQKVMYVQSVANGKPISMKFVQPVPGLLNISISKTGSLLQFHALTADIPSFIEDSGRVELAMCSIF